MIKSSKFYLYQIMQIFLIIIYNWDLILDVDINLSYLDIRRMTEMSITRFKQWSCTPCPRPVFLSRKRLGEPDVRPNQNQLLRTKSINITNYSIQIQVFIKFELLLELDDNTPRANGIRKLKIKVENINWNQQAKADVHFSSVTCREGKTSTFIPF